MTLCVWGMTIIPIKAQEEHKASPVMDLNCVSELPSRLFKMRSDFGSSDISLNY